MTKRYPHTLEVQQSAVSTQDENGNWITPTSSDEPVNVPCRFERNSEGSVIKVADGSDLIFSGVVWMKKGNQIAIGATVKVKVEGVVKALSTVKSIDDTSQTTFRLWL